MIVVPFDSNAYRAPVVRELVERLSIPSTSEAGFCHDWVLTEENDAVVLKELNRPDLKPLYVDLVSIRRRYKSLPISKRGALARALGRSTKTIIDATAGWGQDTMLAWMMGYQVTAIERSPAIGALLLDGWRRYKRYDQNSNYPSVVVDDAKSYLVNHSADCVYLDPMFVLEKKKSSLAKRRLRVLRELVGDDEDREALFEYAWCSARKRVVTKRHIHAKPWFKPDQTFSGKMMCYDVYLRNS